MAAFLAGEMGFARTHDFESISLNAVWAAHHVHGRKSTKKCPRLGGGRPYWLIVLLPLFGLL